LSLSSPRGSAPEAARAVLAWLTRRGVSNVTARIAPGHAPSERVATALGFQPSGELDGDGQQIWQVPRPPESD